MLKSGHFRRLMMEIVVGIHITMEMKMRGTYHVCLEYDGVAQQDVNTDVCKKWKYEVEN